MTASKTARRRALIAADHALHVPPAMTASKTVQRQVLIAADHARHAPPAMTASKTAQRRALIAADRALHVPPAMTASKTARRQALIAAVRIAAHVKVSLAPMEQWTVNPLKAVGEYGMTEALIADGTGETGTMPMARMLFVSETTRPHQI